VIGNQSLVIIKSYRQFNLTIHTVWTTEFDLKGDPPWGFPFLSGNSEGAPPQKGGKPSLSALKILIKGGNPQKRLKTPRGGSTRPILSGILNTAKRVLKIFV